MYIGNKKEARRQLDAALQSFAGMKNVPVVRDQMAAAIRGVIESLLAQGIIEMPTPQFNVKFDGNRVGISPADELSLEFMRSLYEETSST